MIYKDYVEKMKISLTYEDFDIILECVEDEIVIDSDSIAEICDRIASPKGADIDNHLLKYYQSDIKKLRKLLKKLIKIKEDYEHEKSNLHSV